MLYRQTTIRLLLILAVLAPGIGIAHAGTATDSARAFLLAKAGKLGTDPVVTVRPATANMPACTHPQPFLPGNGQRLLGRVTVGVRCADQHVRYLQAQVAVTGEYWVAAQSIPAGTTVTASMLQAREGDLARLPRHAVRERETAVGKVTTRSIARGATIAETALAAPARVHSRRRVTVEATGAGFRVTRQGQALQSGAMGATVRVRMDNRQVLVGVVSGDNLVEVSF